MDHRAAVEDLYQLVIVYVLVNNGSILDLIDPKNLDLECQELKWKNSTTKYKIQKWYFILMNQWMTLTLILHQMIASLLTKLYKTIAQTSCQRAFVKLIQFVIIMGSKFMHGLIKNIKSEWQECIYKMQIHRLCMVFSIIWIGSYELVQMNCFINIKIL